MTFNPNVAILALAAKNPSWPALVKMLQADLPKIVDFISQLTTERTQLEEHITEMKGHRGQLAQAWSAGNGSVAGLQSFDSAIAQLTNTNHDISSTLKVLTDSYNTVKKFQDGMNMIINVAQPKTALMLANPFGGQAKAFAFSNGALGKAQAYLAAGQKIMGVFSQHGLGNIVSSLSGTLGELGKLPGVNISPEISALAETVKSGESLLNPQSTTASGSARNVTGPNLTAALSSLDLGSLTSAGLTSTSSSTLVTPTGPNTGTGTTGTSIGSGPLVTPTIAHTTNSVVAPVSVHPIVVAHHDTPLPTGHQAEGWIVVDPEAPKPTPHPVKTAAKVHQHRA